MRADERNRVTETLDNLTGPIARLMRSLRNPHGIFPLSQEEPSELAIDAIDQFLQRFQQVADIALRKLLPRVALVTSGAPTPQFFRDMLDSLERLEVIDDAGWWADLNMLRNRLVHEYAMEAAVRINELNSAWTAAAVLVAQIERIREIEDKL